MKKLYEVRFSDLKERNKLWKLLTANFFNRYINKDDILLDIGCGFGEFINNIQAKKKIGLDIDRQYSKYLYKDIQFITSSSEKIPLKAMSVDKVFISNVLEHLDRKAIRKTILEMHRVLKDRGEVIVLQPNIRFLTKDYWMFFDHITPIDDRALVEIFSAHEFKVKKIILKFLPFTTKSHFPINSLLINIYLKFPILWRIFGKQSLLIFKK